MKLAFAGLLGALGCILLLAGATTHVATWLDVIGLGAVFGSLMLAN